MFSLGIILLSMILLLDEKERKNIDKYKDMEVHIK